MDDWSWGGEGGVSSLGLCNVSLDVRGVFESGRQRHTWMWIAAQKGMCRRRRMQQCCRAAPMLWRNAWLMSSWVRRRDGDIVGRRWDGLTFECSLDDGVQIAPAPAGGGLRQLSASRRGRSLPPAATGVVTYAPLKFGAASIMLHLSVGLHMIIRQQT